MSFEESLGDALLLAPIVILHGNVDDLLAVPDATALPDNQRALPYVRLTQWLQLHLRDRRYASFFVYNPVDGLLCGSESAAALWHQLTGQAAPDPHHRARTPNSLIPLSVRNSGGDCPGGDQLLDFVHRIGLLSRQDGVALVMCNASFYIRDTHSGMPPSHMIFGKLAESIRPPWASAGTDALPGSRLILTFNDERHIPRALATPMVRRVLVPSSSRADRKLLFSRSGLFHASTKVVAAAPAEREQWLDRIVSMTDDTTIRDLAAMSELSRQLRLGLHPDEFKPLFSRFRFGQSRNYWEDAVKSLNHAEAELSKRVIGQGGAKQRVIEVLRRAARGLTDLSRSGEANQPRGVFLFVGPTGVGKTELAKAIAQLIFGEESAMIRFDMSEFSDRSTVSRLVGSTAGYVGYDEGGQLTNAVSRRPFSVLLFDEIEKAHPDLFNPFLQILDDGRLTSGQGQTVVFSQSVIIFTSNMGTTPRFRANGYDNKRKAVEDLIIRASQQGLIVSQEYPQDVADLNRLLVSVDTENRCRYFREAVAEELRERVGKPELLGRIGVNNIIPFDYMTGIADRGRIVQQKLERINDNLSRSNYSRIRVELTEHMRALLVRHPDGTSLGGRGIEQLVKDFVTGQLNTKLDEDVPASARKLVIDVAYPGGLTLEDQPLPAELENPASFIQSDWHS